MSNYPDHEPKQDLSEEALQAQQRFTSITHDVMERAKKYLLEHEGVDLDERRADWRAHRIVPHSLLAGPVVIEELSYAGYPNATTNGYYEVPREAVTA